MLEAFTSGGEQQTGQDRAVPNRGWSYTSTDRCPHRSVLLVRFVSEDDDPHRYNRTPHYRLYAAERQGPIVICLQDFDYPDYDPRRFLSSQAWVNADEAEQALQNLLTGVDPAVI